MRGQGSGVTVQGSGFRVQGSGFRVQGSGVRGWGSGVSHQRSAIRYPLFADIGGVFLHLGVGGSTLWTGAGWMVIILTVAPS